MDGCPPGRLGRESTIVLTCRRDRQSTEDDTPVPVPAAGRGRLRGYLLRPHREDQLGRPLGRQIGDDIELTRPIDPHPPGDPCARVGPVADMCRPSLSLDTYV